MLLFIGHPLIVSLVNRIVEDSGVVEVLCQLLKGNVEIQMAALDNILVLVSRRDIAENEKSFACFFGALDSFFTLIDGQDVDFDRAYSRSKRISQVRAFW